MDTFQQELTRLAETDFFQLAKREPNSRTRIRLLALGHLRAGKTKTEVIDMFQIVFPTLREKFCVDHALPSVYHVLERCGLSWISARSKHPKSDPAVQEDFKKNSKKK